MRVEPPFEQETTPEEEAGGHVADVVRGLLWGWPEPRFLPLADGKFTLGRDARASFQLVGQRIPRNHASIVKDGPLHLLRDLGSRNGTRHNGCPVDEAPLGEGDVVRVGEWVAV